MSDTSSPHDPPPSDDILAAEFALGLLEGDERAAVQRRLLADPALGEAVDAWSLRLGRIAADEAPERIPPEGLWPRIERQLGEATTAIELKLRRSLTLWRSAAGGMAAVAAGLVVALVWLRPVPPPPTPKTPAAVQAASLAAATGGVVAFIAVLDPDRGELILTPATVQGAPGRSPELWVIPTGGMPVSLGVAQFGKPVRLRVSDLVGAAQRRTLAVTLEPEGGSPSGQPTGPVIASGELNVL